MSHPRRDCSIVLIVPFRLGGCESAWICNRLGRDIHAGYKKLEGPLQKAALVPVVNISGFQLRLRNKKRRFDCQENVKNSPRLVITG